VSRAATFAGFLSFGDCTMTSDEGRELVSIDIQPHPLPEAVRAAIVGGYGGPELADDRRQGRLPGGIALAPGGRASRSPRPFTIITAGWAPENAGLGAEDVGRRFAASTACADAADRAGLAGDIEVWLMPVVTFMYDYLITPAGDWPPAVTS
jgi:hypothetical protein